VTSARAALKLEQLGFANTRALRGGLDAWRELSYPIERLPRAA
jgi:rhodanese-related sulfurtransferase